jgi:hypothetical protein
MALSSERGGPPNGMYNDAGRPGRPGRPSDGPDHRATKQIASARPDGAGYNGQPEPVGDEDRPDAVRPFAPDRME